MILYVLNLMGTFGVFSVVCFRLYETRRPGRGFGCIFQWLLWMGCHLGIGIPMLVILGNQWLAHQAVPPVHIITLKWALAVLLLAPWREPTPETRR